MQVLIGFLNFHYERCHVLCMFYRTFPKQDKLDKRVRHFGTTVVDRNTNSIERLKISGLYSYKIFSFPAHVFAAYYVNFTVEMSSQDH